MEPDFNNLLAKKIRSVEQQRISWNKSEVWLKINDQITPVKKTYTLYYYAAAVLFLLLFNAYQLENEQTVLLNKFSSYETSTTQVPEILTAGNEADLVSSKKIISSTPSMHHVKPENNLALSSVDLQHLPHQEYLEVNQEEVTPARQTELTTSTEVAKEKIIPIVGVIGLSDPREIVSQAKRKKLFRKLETPEKEYVDRLNNTIIIARSK